MAELAAGPQVYARATPRLLAVIRDLIVQFAILVAIFLPASFQPRLLVTLGPIGLLAFLFYEPVFLTVRGATIGQRAMNLRIVRARDLAPVSFPRAVLRTMVKAFVGVPAFLVMYFTRRHQALQDLVAGTVVVPYDPQAIHPAWFEPARGPEPAYAMPHRVRRLLVIVAYECLFIAIMVRVVIPGMLPNCFPRPRLTCSAAESLLTKIILFSFLFGLIAIAIAGARGFLWGARRGQVHV